MRQQVAKQLPAHAAEQTGHAGRVSFLSKEIPNCPAPGLQPALPARFRGWSPAPAREAPDRMPARRPAVAALPCRGAAAGSAGRPAFSLNWSSFAVSMKSCSSTTLCNWLPSWGWPLRFFTGSTPAGAPLSGPAGPVVSLATVSLLVFLASLHHMHKILVLMSARRLPRRRKTLIFQFGGSLTERLRRIASYSKIDRYTNCSEVVQ